ncbi:MAG: hypothetical protein OXU79_00025 [Gemmatimonadota bacterium]|nr:hypothetical protein [Gemmatimonadota bacterium]
MPDIRESIDEMIEESYLSGLTEGEIRADMERFVSICGRVIRENVHDRKQTRRLTEQLARARALSLVEDTSGSRDDTDLLISNAGARSSLKGGYAERAARNKRLILRVIRECDPKLEQLIEQERFSGTLPEPSSPALPIGVDAPRNRVKDFFLKTCFAVTLLLILLLVYLVLLQNV